MLTEIQKLITQIEEYLSDKEGFSTEVTHKGAIIEVKRDDGHSTQYDGYELLLYTLASRKLGSDISLNINDTENGKVFVVTSDAKLDLRQYFTEQNEKLIGAGNENILSVAFVDQPSSSQFPYSVMTIYKNGNWMRYDLTVSEILYAHAFGLELELDDSVFTFKKLREVSRKVQEEVQE